MSEPTFIRCDSPDALPSAGELAELVTRDRHVVLVFATPTDVERAAFDAATVIEGLRSRLTDDVVTFDAGGRQGERWVTLKRVIPTPVVVEHAEAICAAARASRATATRLMHALAGVLGVGVGAFADPLIRLTLGDRDGGDIDADWAYSFHGMECRFTNRLTGQDVEVELGFGEAGVEFGVLDPYSFHRFVLTTPAFAPVAVLFRDAFHDPLRALVVLEQRSRFRCVVRPLTGEEGLVVV
jgi:hypothetical protein